MKVFSILEPFFRALSDGKIIRLTVAWVLRVTAVLGALGGVVWFVVFAGLAFKSTDMALGARSTGFMLGGLLFSLFGLAFGYLWLGICMFRARSVLELGDSHFTVLSILSILFRLYGELMFVTYTLIGVGGCLFIWLSDVNPTTELGALGSQLPFAMGAASGFVGGIEMAVFMLLLAFAGIVLCYALAELSIVLVEIALNTRGLPIMAGAASAAPPAFAPTAPVPAGARAATSSPVVAQRPSCRQCGQILDPGGAFCAECGAAAGQP